MGKKEVAKPKQGLISLVFGVMQHGLKNPQPRNTLPSIYEGNENAVVPGSSLDQESLGQLHINSSASWQDTSQGYVQWSPLKLEQYKIQKESGGWVDYAKNEALSPAQWQQWQSDNGQWVDYTPEQTSHYLREKRYKEDKANGWKDYLLAIPE